MPGINKVTLIGNLGREPEAHVFASGEKVVNFSIATSIEWKDKASGEKKSQVEWHHITAFGVLAGICERYLIKGSKVYLEGRLKTDKYTDKHNIERSVTKIIAEKMQMLDSRNEGDNSRKEVNGNVSSRSSNCNFDDDIPF